MENISSTNTNINLAESVHNHTSLNTGPFVGTLIVLCPIVLVVVLGNLLVITAIAVVPSLRKPQNMFFVSLAMVDLSVGLWILPLNIANIVQKGWFLGKGMCKFYITLDLTLCNMSILHLCAIAVDRYRAISDGIHYIQQRSFKSVFIIIFGITTVSIWISSPPVLGWDKEWLEDSEKTNECHLLTSPGYVIYSAFGSFFFPMILMLYLYTKIYFALRQRIREKARIKSVAPGMGGGGGGGGGGVMEFELEHSGEPDSTSSAPIIAIEPTSFSSTVKIGVKQSSSSKAGNDSHSNTLPNPKKMATESPFKKKESNVSLMSVQFQDYVAKKQKFSLKKERNAARTLGIIIGAFSLCWLPFCLMYVTVPFLPEEYKPGLATFEFFTWLGYLNSALNPIIYTVFNMEFRKAFKKILCIQK